MAHAHLRLNDTTQAIAALKEINAFARPLQPLEAEFFSRELRALGRANIQRWPREPLADETYMDKLPHQVVQLTEREITVLVALASDKSRKEMASDLFVSVNTLKSQIRAVYRKLGASSREEALRNATARGLL